MTIDSDDIDNDDGDDNDNDDDDYNIGDDNEKEASYSDNFVFMSFSSRQTKCCWEVQLTDIQNWYIQNVD